MSRDQVAILAGVEPGAPGRFPSLQLEIPSKNSNAGPDRWRREFTADPQCESVAKKAAPKAEQSKPKRRRRPKIPKREMHRQLSQDIAIAMRDGDLRGASSLYCSLARRRFDLGLDFFDALNSSHQCNLMSMKQVGVKRMTISTCQDERCCSKCRALEGKTFTIKKALEDDAAARRARGRARTLSVHLHRQVARGENAFQSSCGYIC